MIKPPVANCDQRELPLTHEPLSKALSGCGHSPSVAIKRAILAPTSTCNVAWPIAISRHQKGYLGAHLHLQRGVATRHQSLSKGLSWRPPPLATWRGQSPSVAIKRAILAPTSTCNVVWPLAISRYQKGYLGAHLHLQRSVHNVNERSPAGLDVQMIVTGGLTWLLFPSPLEGCPGPAGRGAASRTPSAPGSGRRAPARASRDCRASTTRGRASRR